VLQPAHACTSPAPHSFILAQSAAATRYALMALVGPDGSLSVTDAAWVADFQRGQAAALAILASGQAFAAQQRMESLRSFLDGAEAVLAGLSMYARGVTRALRRRIAWASDMCVALGDDAGVQADAQAMLPPLVAILRLRGDNAEGTRLLALASTQPPAGTPPARFVIADAR
jgi:hypothetical protein